MLDELVEQILARFSALETELSDPAVIGDRERFTAASRAYRELEPAAKLAVEYRLAADDAAGARELLEDGEDPEIRELLRTSIERLETLEEEIRLAMVERDPNDDKNVIIEIRPGIGGDEAGIWAGDVYRMLTRYAERLGFKVQHVYGLTEVYGPSGTCEPQPGWADLTLSDRARNMARQGVPAVTQEDLMILDPGGHPVPADGTTMGELAFRGNVVMKGYLKNQAATAEAFRHGWFLTGDLGVLHKDGYVEIKDRAKDIIISGGENISSLEVEDVLYRHPAVREAAVVAMPDEKWGEIPLAVITFKEGATATEAELTSFCRQHLAGFKIPKRYVFEELPKTSTGKIQKHLLHKRAQAILEKQK